MVGTHLVRRSDFLSGEASSADAGRGLLVNLGWVRADCAKLDPVSAGSNTFGPSLYGTVGGRTHKESAFTEVFEAFNCHFPQRNSVVMSYPRPDPGPKVSHCSNTEQARL